MMFRKTVVVLLVVSAGLTGCATNYQFKPVALDGTTITYDHGDAITASSKALASVQVRPLEVNKQGRLVFGVAARNNSTNPFTFGIENVAVLDGSGTLLQVYTQQQLVRQAKNRATWAAVAVALSGAAAAYAANQNSYRSTNGYISSPYGNTTFHSTTYDPQAAALGTAAATAATGASLYAINQELNRTIDHYRGNVLQITTVPPGDLYGGEVITQHVRLDHPLIVAIKVEINGEHHEFRYEVSKQGG